MSKRITIYSGEGIKHTHEKLEALLTKLQEKEDQSIVRGIWNYLTKKPLIGKPRGK